MRENECLTRAKDINNNDNLPMICETYSMIF